MCHHCSWLLRLLYHVRELACRAARTGASATEGEAHLFRNNISSWMLEATSFPTMQAWTLSCTTPTHAHLVCRDSGGSSRRRRSNRSSSTHSASLLLCLLRLWLLLLWSDSLLSMFELWERTLMHLVERTALVTLLQSVLHIDDARFFC